MCVRAPPGARSHVRTQTPRGLHHCGQAAQAARPRHRAARDDKRAAPARPPQALPVLQGQDRAGRLQGHRDAAPVHLRARQDPLAPHHRRLPPSPEPDRDGRQARPRAGAAALRRRAGARGAPAAAAAGATATATGSASSRARGDPAPGRRGRRREGRRRRRLQGLPAQLPDPAQARRSRRPRARCESAKQLARRPREGRAPRPGRAPASTPSCSTRPS